MTCDKNEFHGKSLNDVLDFRALVYCSRFAKEPLQFDSAGCAIVWIRCVMTHIVWVFCVHTSAQQRVATPAETTHQRLSVLGHNTKQLPKVRSHQPSFWSLETLYKLGAPLGPSTNALLRNSMPKSSVQPNG